MTARTARASLAAASLTLALAATGAMTTFTVPGAAGLPAERTVALSDTAPAAFAATHKDAARLLPTEPKTIPAPQASVPALVVSVPSVPKQPKARTYKDAPKLTAHTKTVRATLAATAATEKKAQAGVSAAEVALRAAAVRLARAQERTAQIGVAVPETPKPPTAPKVTSTVGKPVPVATAPVTKVVTATVEKITDAVEAAPATPAAPVEIPAAPFTPQSFVQALEAQNEARQAQVQLASAQAALVAAVTVENVTSTQVDNLAKALTSAELELRNVPKPPPPPPVVTFKVDGEGKPVTKTVASVFGPEGCPTVAPANTLRGGATNLAKLCADSVAAARTPQAALAIKWALNHLGMEYSQARRNTETAADCSSFVTRAYTGGGLPLAPKGVNAPTTFTIASASWAVPVKLSEARPGDMVLPYPGHVGMVLANGWMVHTSTDGDVSHVQPLYNSAFLTVKVDPAKV